ncbi:MAG: DEAD/DEAH box helicase [Acidobacteriota bacterium]|nr:DEAD/DEAH box helicase [Acidobacteriota bacterium]
MDVFELRERITSEYSGYITSFFTIRDERIRKHVDVEFGKGKLWPPPLAQLNPSFEPGLHLDDLIAEGVLHPECRHIFRAKSSDGRVGDLFRFHKHQEEAVRLAGQGVNYVLTTGTGSGKSLSYIAPIVDHVLRQGSGKGIRALIVYPMNALANSQEGELEKFLKFGYNTPPVTYALYTGQDKEERKQKIIARPPDILLTNYVMLEYILTRPKERPLVATMSNLRFLVLDELHTYRGRQGADVAMLMRRLRQASGARDLLMVGTSATLAGEGSWRRQQREVARTAELLFGDRVEPEHVIGETLRARTPRADIAHPSFAASLRAARGLPFPDDEDAFREHPLACWIEKSLGLEWDEESRRYRRGTPVPISGSGGLAEKLTHEVDMEEAEAARWIQAALMHPVSPGGKPFFAFRLHQFLAKGETVYASLEAPSTRFLTLNAQQYVPGAGKQRELFPLAFCRECGQEYYTVHRISQNGRTTGFLPRDIGDRSEGEGADLVKEPGFLMTGEGIWPEEMENQLKLWPDAWVEEKKGRLAARRTYRPYLPVSANIDPKGIPHDRGITVWWIKRPFRFCLRCHVAFNARGSDFARLSTLGTEGRSTATTITTKTALRYLRDKKTTGASIEDLAAEARKLLSFTDNRQDASLQAGHFNDFIQVVLIRCGLYRALAPASEGLRYRDLNQAVFHALDLPYEAYARDADRKYGREDVQARFREVLGYLLFRDLEGGWRINQPNLEQCGLLRFEYKELDTLCREESDWANAHPILAGARPEERERVCRTLLDFLRRQLALDAQPLDPMYQESIPKDSRDLTSAWSISNMESMTRAKTAFPTSQQVHETRRGRRRKQDNHLYLPARGGFGRYLRRPDTFKNAGAPPLAETQQMIAEICDRLTLAGILRVIESGVDGLPDGYRINANCLIWRPGDGKRRAEDPIRIPAAPKILRTNDYFLDLYRSDTRDLAALHAAEHTAQVPSDIRREREDAFRKALLPLLFCSPTMELGVDIKDLNVVNMRNVPPTPANYAQRSGRAGRGGQAAFVFTYCTSGSPHDSYFFRRPEKMVSGQVKPPRLDLLNEDLVRAHVHAVWLHIAGLDLGSSLQDLLDLSGQPPNPRVFPEIMDRLRDSIYRRGAFDAAKAAFGEVIDKLAAQQRRRPDDWLDDVLARLPYAFEAACDRWRDLYVAAWHQAERQGRIVRDSSRSAEDRQRAKGLREDAEMRLKLLLDTGEYTNSDFYSYRYFAGEGFLPGYNFPRLPITAFLRGHRRGGSEEEDALSRPRFLAISEFGPRAIIYHEGARYMINRVDIPVGNDGADPTVSAQQCGSCGYMHPPRDRKGYDNCEHCKAENFILFDNLFRMQNVGTRKRDRITCDEEERTRTGYRLKVGVRFPERDGHRDSRKARLMGANGEPLAELEYGAAATITRLSLGWRNARQDTQPGYVLDLERGYWARNSDTEEDSEPGDVMSNKTRRVIPFVEDTRNALLLTPVGEPSLEAMATLQAALKHALQAHYQIEDRELAAEALPGSDLRKVLLFYESSEGGAGVLRRLLDDEYDLAQAAAEALRLAHYRVEGKEVTDLGHAPGASESCEAACYDCLLSYYNQTDHRRIDRGLLPELLTPWLRARVEASPVTLPREQHYRQLHHQCESDLEINWLDKVYQEGYHLPDKAQAVVQEAGCRPDFLYTRPDVRVAVFIDGPHHDSPRQQERDRETDESLDDHGWTAVRFHYDANWDEILETYSSTFGSPREKAEAPDMEPEPAREDDFDPEDFDQARRPLITRLNRVDGLRVEPGHEYSGPNGNIGLSQAELTFQGRRLTLLDSSDPDCKALADHLRKDGARIMILDSDGSDPYPAILAALGV